MNIECPCSNKVCLCFELNFTGNRQHVQSDARNLLFNLSCFELSSSVKRHVMLIVLHSLRSSDTNFRKKKSLPRAHVENEIFK